MCIEMDASVLIRQQMPWRRFEKGLKKKHRTEKTMLSLNVKDIFCTSLLLWNYIIIVVIVIEFAGYGGFSVLNTTIVVVEKIFLSYLK